MIYISKKNLQVRKHTFAAGKCVLVLLEGACTNICRRKMCQWALVGIAGAYVHICHGKCVNGHWRRGPHIKKLILNFTICLHPSFFSISTWQLGQGLVFDKIHLLFIFSPSSPVITTFHFSKV